MAKINTTICPSPSPSTTDHEEMRGICSDEVKETDKAIECDKCKYWIHTKCNNITNKQYKNLQTNPETFICKNCNKCNICDKTVAKNHKAIECNTCLKWVHMKCNKLDAEDYTADLNDENFDFFCINCLSENLPMLKLDDNQFELTTKGIDYPEEIDVNELLLSSTQLDIIKKINASISHDVGSNDDSDDNSEDTHPIDCKYYTIEQLNSKKLDSTKHFSILHLNIHSLEFHIEELRIALKLIDIKFDFICITESKIKKNYQPKSKIDIENYQTPVGTPTEANKGGVLIYVKNGIDFKPREDLNIYKPKELESYFIEAINQKGINFIIGSIYRHPCMEPSIFIDDYMQ